MGQMHLAKPDPAGTAPTGDDSCSYSCHQSLEVRDPHPHSCRAARMHRDR